MGKRVAIASARIFCLLTLSMWATALAGQSFQTSVLTPGMWTGGLDWGDYDADGDLDFVVGGLITGGTPTTKIYRNDAGTFTGLSVPLAGCMHGCVKWGDIDQDNDLDLLVAGSTGTEMYRNGGDDSFEQIATTFPVIYYGNADFADYDLDGDADLLLSASANGLVIFRNDGGTFSQQSPALTTLVNGKAWWGDSDNDGDQDILLLADSSNTGINRVYLNNNGNFQKVSNTGLPMPYPHSFGNWADMNNDGYLDMIFSTLSGTSPILRVFLNNRNNSFTQLATMNGVGYQAGFLAPADYNADGYMDYMISGDNGSGRYFELMKGTSQQMFQSAASLTGLDNSWMAWGDYDGDGQLDGAYVGNTSSDEVLALGVFKQTNGAVNSAPLSPSQLMAQVSGNQVTFSWTAPGRLDQETGNAALTYNMWVKNVANGNWVLTPLADVGTGQRLVAARGNAGNCLQHTIKNLPDGLYDWGVQTIDGGLRASSFASGGQFVVNQGNAYYIASENGTNLCGSNGQVELRVLPAANAYEWLLNNAPAPGTHNQQVYSATTPGAYTCRITTASNTMVYASNGTMVQTQPVPAAPSLTIPSPSCFGQQVTVTATPGVNGDNCNWYIVPSGGTPFARSNQLTISFSGSVTYYVSSVNTQTGCESTTRTTCAITSLPPIGAATTVSPVEPCQMGVVTLTASPGSNGNNVNWYRSSYDAIPFYTGRTMQVDVQQPVTYYLRSVDTASGCTSTSITPLAVQMGQVPGLPTANGTTICSPAAVTLTATPHGANSCRWYASDTGATVLATGTSYTTPIVQHTTVIYVSSRDNATGCEGERLAVTIHVGEVSAAPLTSDVQGYGNSSLVLYALPPHGATTCKWYREQSCTTLLGTGNSYMTGNLSTTTSYYVRGFDESLGCSGPVAQVQAIISAAPTLASNPDYIANIPQNYSRKSFQEVNMFSGDLNYSLHLASIGGALVSYDLTAEYNSRSVGLTPLNTTNELGGMGWKLCDYPKVAYHSSDGSYHLLMPGRSYPLRLESGSGTTKTMSAGEDFHLWRIQQLNATSDVSRQRWTLTDDNGTEFLMENVPINIAEGGLSAQVWNLSKVRDSQGIDSLMFTYNSRRLTTVASAFAEKIELLYDGYGRLITINEYGVTASGANWVSGRTSLTYAAQGPSSNRKNILTTVNHAVNQAAPGSTTLGFNPEGSGATFEYATSDYPWVLTKVHEPIGSSIGYTYASVPINRVTWHPVSQVDLYNGTSHNYGGKNYEDHIPYALRYQGFVSGPGGYYAQYNEVTVSPGDDEKLNFFRKKTTSFETNSGDAVFHGFDEDYLSTDHVLSGSKSFKFDTDWNVLTLNDDRWLTSKTMTLNRATRVAANGATSDWKGPADSININFYCYDTHEDLDVEFFIDMYYYDASNSMIKKVSQTLTMDDSHYGRWVNFSPKFAVQEGASTFHFEIYGGNAALHHDFYMDDLSVLGAGMITDGTVVYHFFNGEPAANLRHLPEEYRQTFGAEKVKGSQYTGFELGDKYDQWLSIHSGCKAKQAENQAFALSAYNGSYSLKMRACDDGDKSKISTTLNLPSGTNKLLIGFNYSNPLLAGLKFEVKANAGSASIDSTFTLANSYFADFDYNYWQHVLTVPSGTHSASFSLEITHDGSSDDVNEFYLDDLTFIYLQDIGYNPVVHPLIDVTDPVMLGENYHTRVLTNNLREVSSHEWIYQPLNASGQAPWAGLIDSRNSDRGASLTGTAVAWKSSGQTGTVTSAWDRTRADSAAVIVENQTSLTYAWEIWDALGANGQNQRNAVAMTVNSLKPEPGSNWQVNQASVVQWKQFTGLSTTNGGKSSLWAPWRTFALIAPATANDISAVQSHLRDSNYTPPANLWQLQRTVLRIDGLGNVLEDVSGAGIHSTSLWSLANFRDDNNVQLHRVPVAIAEFTGAGAGNCFYHGFEAYEPSASGVLVSSGYAHGGLRSVTSSSNSTFTYPFEFNSQGASASQYLFSAWVMPIGSASQVRITVKSSTGTIYKQQSFTGITRNKWQYFEVLFPLSVSQESLRFTIDNGNNTNVGYVDDIRFSPGSSNFSAQVYEIHGYLSSGELDNQGQVWHNLQNRNGSSAGYSAPGYQPISVSNSYLSTSASGLFNEQQPNGAMEAMCRGTGTHFNWDDGLYSDQWTRSGVNISPGRATFTAGTMTLQSTYLPTNKRDWGISLRLRGNTPSSVSGSQSFSLDFGSCGLQLQYSSTRLILKTKTGNIWYNADTMAIALIGNSAIGTDVQVFFAGTNMLAWVNGQPVPNTINTQNSPVTQLKLLSTAGSVFMQFEVMDLVLMTDPLIHVAFSDGMNNLLQDQTVIGNDLIIEETLYDNVLRPAVDTKMARLTATRPGMNAGFITSFDWGTGKISGTAIAAGAYCDDPSNDGSYAYTRAVFYHQPDDVEAFLFNPGKDFALRDKTNWEKAKAWMYSDFPTFVSDAIQIAGYAFDAVDCILEPQMAPLIIAMDVGGLVVDHVLSSTDNTAGEMPVTGVLYDSQKRAQKITLPKANAKSHPQPSQAVSYTYDFAGELLSSTYPESGTTNYAYDQWGNVRFAQTADNRHEGVILYFKYDMWGRMIETGYYSGSWNAATMNSLAQNANFPDANTATITNLLLYDGSGTDSAYCVNKRGYLTQRTTYAPDGFSSVEQFWYDSYGNVKGTRIVENIPSTPSESYSMSYAYDIAGNTTKIIYPPYNGHSFIVTHAYDKQNNLIQIGTDTDPAAYATYSWNPDGSLQHSKIPRTSSAWYTQSQRFNAPGWLTSITGRDSTAGHQTTQLNAAYNYNYLTDWWSRLWGEKYYNGNIASLDLSRYNWTGTYQNEETGLTYDDNGRLDKYTSEPEELLILGYRSGDPNPLQDNYDLNGNLVMHLYSFTNGGTHDSLAYTYSYDNQKNTLKYIARLKNWLSGNAGSYHDWDTLKVTTSAAGCMTALSYVSHAPSYASYRPVAGATDSTSVRTLTYNKIGLVTDVSWSGTRQTSGNLSIYYDGQNDRIRKVSTVGNTVTTTSYVRGLSHYPLMEVVKTGSSIVGKYYVIGPDGPLVMVSKSGSTTNSWVIVKDKVGSTLGLINRATGNHDATYEYDSYGQLVPKGCVNPSTYTYLFAGMEYDSETRLYNFNARLYDPWMKMFISPDPGHQDLGTPYAYCGWDPYNRLDPSGNEWFLENEVVLADDIAKAAAKDAYEGKSVRDMINDPIRINREGKIVDLSKGGKKNKVGLRRPLQWRIEFRRRINSFDPAVIAELHSFKSLSATNIAMGNLLRPGKKHEFFQVANVADWLERGINLDDIQRFALPTEKTYFTAWDPKLGDAGEWAHKMGHNKPGVGKGPGGKGRKFSPSMAHKEVEKFLLDVPKASTDVERQAARAKMYQTARDWITAQIDSQVYSFHMDSEAAWLECLEKLSPTELPKVGAKRDMAPASVPEAKKPKLDE